MNTSNYEQIDHRQTPNIERFRKPLAGAASDDDEQFDAAGASPLGQLLKLIGALPEIRREKVEHVRRQIDHGQYDITTNLDAALDRVLEEFLADD
jgi:anti-sigma28 factor (negative regulator of flagellin synthesis)